MKTILGVLITVSAAIALAGGAYEFRSPTPRDRALAQLVGDWMFHDDWHAPIPTNAYAARWQKEIPDTRDALRAKYTGISIDVRSETNSFALFTYNVRDRVLSERAASPDPWPTPRIIVEEHSTAGEKRLCVLKWTGGLWYYLGIQETTNGPVAISIENRRSVD